jgi:hypothetical protein
VLSAATNITMVANFDMQNLLFKILQLYALGVSAVLFPDAYFHRRR